MIKGLMLSLLVLTQIEGAVLSNKEAVDVKRYDLEPSQVRSILTDYKASSLYGWRLNKNYKIKLSNNRVSTILLSYDYTQAEIQDRQRLIDNEVKKIVTEAKKQKDIKEQIHSAYEYIITNYTYDDAKVHIDESELILAKKGVCQGFTVLLKDAVTDLGVETKVAISEPMHHEWLKVKLDNKWYNIDATDTSGTLFLLTDSQLEELGYVESRTVDQIGGVYEE